MLEADKHLIEDVIIEELRKAGGYVKIDDRDVGRLRYSGTIDVGRVANAIWMKFKEIDK